MYALKFVFPNNMLLFYKDSDLKRIWRWGITNELQKMEHYLITVTELLEGKPP